MVSNTPHQVVLIDRKTGEPLEDGIINLTEEEYSLIETSAQQRGVSFAEAFIKAVYSGLALIGSPQQFRFTISELGGAERSYSYLLNEPVPVGVYDEKTLPEDLEGELEAFAQSSDVPPFLYNPDGKLRFTVTAETSYPLRA